MDIYRYCSNVHHLSNNNIIINTEIHLKDKNESTIQP